MRSLETAALTQILVIYVSLSDLSIFGIKYYSFPRERENLWDVATQYRWLDKHSY
jgi:hypothetical protein